MAIEFGATGFRFASANNETAFRKALRDGARRGRRVLVLINVVFTLAAPVLGPVITGTDAVDYQPLLPTLLLLILPTVVFALCTIWRDALYLRSTWAMVLMTLASVVFTAQTTVLMARLGEQPLIAHVALLSLAFCVFAHARFIAVIPVVAVTVLAGLFCATHPAVPVNPRDLLVFAALCGLALGSGVSMELIARRAWLARQSLAWSATIDELTGIYNRRAFEDQGDRVVRQATRDQHGLAVLAVDLDHFKAINDTYGHLIGDEVIRCVGEELRVACRRPLDLPARLGGEEFVLVYFNVNHEQTRQLAETIQNRIRGLVIPAGAKKVRVTASIGAVTGTPTSETIMRDFMARADRLLYSAKHAGRDRIAMGRLHDALDSPQLTNAAAASAAAASST